MRKELQSKQTKRQPKVGLPPNRRQVEVRGLLYDVVYIDRKPKYLGRHGSKESEVAYTQFCSEWWARKARLTAEGRSSPIPLPPPKVDGVSDITVKELAAAFLEHAEKMLKKPNYTHYRIVVVEFLVKLYGDVLAEGFRPRDLKLIRNELIHALNKRGKPRFCRGMVNEYTRRIATVFAWGADDENDLVSQNIVAVLKAVKPLPEDYPGTFDHEEREDVPDAVIKATLPFMPPTLQAMVKLQRLLGWATILSDTFGIRHKTESQTRLRV